MYKPISPNNFNKIKIITKQKIRNKNQEKMIGDLFKDSTNPLKLRVISCIIAIKKSNLNLY
tara:strand:+ start:1159 stop:1341 length:183 start_codon:yes stop_codon:yes gene_type:complete